MVATKNIDDFEKTRDKVVDMALAAFVVIGLLALGASLYRITVIGWQPVMAVHVVIWIAVVGVFLFRRRLVFHVRAWFLLGVLIILGIGGLLTFGLVSVSIVAFLVASVLATILFGFGPGLVVAIFALAVIAAVGVGVAFEWVRFDFDIASYAVAPASWFTAFVASVLLMSLCIFGLSRIHDSLINSLHQMDEKSKQLENEIERRKQSEHELSEHKNHLEELIEERTRDLEHQVTERKFAEKSLRDSEELYRSLVEKSPGILYIHDGKKILFANPGLVKLLGAKDQNEILGRSPLDFIHKDDWQKLPFPNPSNSTVAETKLIEKRYLRLDGSTVTMESYGIPVRLHGKDAFLVFANDLSDRKFAEASILAAKNAADVANRAKSEFLSSMRHELRTPLNAILGFSQMLDYNPKEPLTEAQKSSVDHIIKGGNHLLELINDVLDLSAIESGKITYSIEDVDIHSVCDECLELVQTLAKKKNIKLIADNIGSGLKPVRLDYMRVKQIILNLLSNAIKYNTEGGSVTLDCQEIPGDMLRISIKDTGLGIAEDLQHELFKPFSRLGAESTEIEGTGIGLTITQKLVEIMGGRIDFDSTVGEGSRFWIEFPFVEVDRDSKAAAVTATLDEVGAKQLPDVEATLLYVEDNPANLDLMELIVSRVPSLNMISAHNAELGLELAASKNPDLIILDINLPGMDGYGALKRLKQNKDTKHIPVIALTANATKSDVKRGLEAGFLEYLTKPLDVVMTLEAIKEVLEPV